MSNPKASPSTNAARLTPAVQRVIEWHRQHDDVSRKALAPLPAAITGWHPAARAESSAAGEGRQANPS